MRISISNIAWDVENDDVIAEVLARHGVDAIDVAPGKYFPDPAMAKMREMDAVRKAWLERGIAITGMQALLFGSQGLNMFADADTQARMLRHLGHVCRIAYGLGARHLVFGSPRNRDRGSLGDAAVETAATDFFRRLGDIAAQWGVVMCLEPNPTAYGANFMTTSDETAAMVRVVNHPAIAMQLDTGAIAMNGECAQDVVARNFDVIGHVHASEPNLAVIGDAGADHRSVAEAIRTHCPGRIVTIEMRSSDPQVASVERAVQIVREAYGDHDDV